jgi:hypothetical protein
MEAFMSKMILPAETALRLSEAKGRMELRDAEGNLIGYFEPPQKLSPPGRTLDEILRYAGLKRNEG